LGVPIFDTTLVTVLRLRYRIAPWRGGKDHSSHRLTALGLSERKSISLLYALGVILAFAGLAITKLGTYGVIALAIILISAGAILALKLAKVECYKTRNHIHPREAG
jgi:UDP-GlcNAc:undecaprenyl-phosphate GlcNAc-1-phosphate transferase